MAPKKMRKKPPIRPNADGTGFVRVSANDVALNVRGCEGVTASETDTTLQTVVKDRCTARGTQVNVEMRLKTCLDSSLPSNEARLSPGVCKALGVVSGAVLHVVSHNYEAFVEVFLSSSCSAQHIVLADDVVAALAEKEVTVSALKGLSAIQPLSLLVVEITSEQANGMRAVQTTETMSVPLVTIRAAFRRQYQRRLVYKGMQTTVRIATHLFFVEVVKCVCIDTCERNGEKVSQQQQQREERQVALGLLMDCTVIRDGAFEARGDNDDFNTTHDVLEKKKNTVQHVLIVGEPGTGKSRFLQKEGRDAVMLYSRHVETVSVEALPQGEFSDVSTSTVLREAFARAKTSAPSTLLVDDLHLICGAKTDSSVGSLWAMSLVSAAFAEELDDIFRQQIDVRVVASASSVNAVNGSLLSPGRLDKHVTLLTPGSAEERHACLVTCLKERNALGTVSDETLFSIAKETNGFTQRDLAKLVDVAMVENYKMTGNTLPLSAASLLVSRKLVRPSALKQFEVSVPQVTWDDIGGSEAAKKTLQDCVAWCLGKQQWIFRRFKLSPPKGVLLYGPPGCSKTMLAKALANESKMNFISVKGPEVFSKWVGDSEKAVRDIFVRARAVAPCVVFIDELDGMCGHRGRGGVSDRVISQFLTELDGLPSALSEKYDALVLVAATNRPDNIDTAVLRPGRIDRKVYVGLPDLYERRAIVRIHFARIPVDPTLDADYVASRTEGYSGAEVVAVVKEAAFLRVTFDASAAYITREDIDAALQRVRPRINQKDLEWYKRWSTGKDMTV